jgi:hypothetical protein
MVSDWEDERGRSTRGRLELRQTDTLHQFYEQTPFGRRRRGNRLLWGWSQIDSKTPTIPWSADPASRDPEHPGVLVHASGALEFGVWRGLDGSSTTLKIERITDTGFSGIWGSDLGIMVFIRDGRELANPHGHFCAVRRTAAVSRPDPQPVADDPPLVLADSVRNLILAAGRMVVDSAFATVRDTAPACVSFVNERTHFRPEPADLRRLADSRRRFVPRTQCPRTYTSMIARVDSRGRPVDPAPRGYVDPHYLQFVLPGRWTGDRLDIDIRVVQGTRAVTYLCVTRLTEGVPIARCRQGRITHS